MQFTFFMCAKQSLVYLFNFVSDECDIFINIVATLHIFLVVSHSFLVHSLDFNFLFSFADWIFITLLSNPFVIKLKAFLNALHSRLCQSILIDLFIISASTRLSQTSRFSQFHLISFSWCNHSIIICPLAIASIMMSLPLIKVYFGMSGIQIFL